MIGDVSAIVQIVSFPLALIGIFLAYREGRNSRDLQAALAFAESFRGSWEGSWRKALDKAENLAQRGKEPTGELREELFHMLNWLDGVGCMIDSDILARPQTVLASISPQLKRAVEAAGPVLKDDEAKHRPGYWRGVRTLEKELAHFEYSSHLPLVQSSSTADPAT
jgi:hypothetical protein